MRNILEVYAQKTRQIAENALKNIDEKSNFQIYTALDIGAPYDVDRLAGGFPTGVFMEWECSTPIIPVDATVNICSATVVKIKNISDDQIIYNNLNSMKTIFEDSSYSLNFDSGNHFIILCKNSNDERYLVLHSNPREFTKDYNGLYPIKGNWYFDRIKIYQDTEGRYFRYILGKDAELFYKKSEMLIQYSEVRHEDVVEFLLRGYGDVDEVKHYHHYFMPDPNSIAIGCYIVGKGEGFPIFTKPSYPIDLVEMIHGSKFSTKHRKFIVPHGWGKEWRDPDITIIPNYDNRMLSINGRHYQIFEKQNFYKDELLQYRNFDSDGVNNFYNFFKDELDVIIKERLYQIISYNQSGLNWIE